MKLIDSIYIALSAAAFLIGVNQVMATPGINIAENYHFFMISFIFLILLRLSRQKRKEKNKQENE